MHTKTQEKGAVAPQETDPDLPVSVQESLVEAWVSGGLLEGWGQSSSACGPVWAYVYVHSHSWWWWGLEKYLQQDLCLFFWIIN